ncbi:hypothetical protein PS623_04589 [Pseudomonas fluorescens]|uniref:hypothetical protein n=1 Tax=Pseudomonas fluorescens TaxID=294 RepID=UPI001241A19C|nr:hypothetical protein [Pseudomonas fluorescens]VVN27056.1 hypothetical protein PS623_04589 [Pseudomonas fluorescens]
MPKEPTQADKSQGDITTLKTPAPPRLRGKDRVKRFKSRTMSAAQFEAVRPFLSSLSVERIEAARLAMVEEKKFDDIRKQFDWQSRQAVDRAVSIVWKVFQKYQESQAAVSQLTAPQE